MLTEASDYSLKSYKYRNTLIHFRRLLLTPWSCVDYFYDGWVWLGVSNSRVPFTPII